MRVRWADVGAVQEPDSLGTRAPIPWARLTSARGREWAARMHPRVQVYSADTPSATATDSPSTRASFGTRDGHRLPTPACLPRPAACMEDPGTSRNAYRRPHVTIGADRVVSDVQQPGSSREHSLCAERDGHSTEKDEEQAVSSAMKLRYSLHQQDTNQRGADTARELDVPANGQQTNRRLRVPTASRRHDRKRSCVGMPEWDHAIKDAPSGSCPKARTLRGLLRLAPKG